VELYRARRHIHCDHYWSILSVQLSYNRSWFIRQSSLAVTSKDTYDYMITGGTLQFYWKCKRYRNIFLQYICHFAEDNGAQTLVVIQLTADNVQAERKHFDSHLFLRPEIWLRYP
jgi:hypothetical protein